MAPRRTASADLAAVRASGVRGMPVASIEALCGVSKSICMKGGAVKVVLRANTHAAEEVFLKVEFEVGSVFFYDVEDLAEGVSIGCHRENES